MTDLIIIYGPTAVGKSKVGVEVAKLVNGEIISADSMQIYKHLNVGSAKVTIEEMDGIAHHMIDIKEPAEDYSVSNFCVDCKKCIKDIISRGKVPIIVGGTGLYLKSLISGYNFGETAKNIEFRNSLESLSNEEIYKEILKIDANCNVDKFNRQRLIRAYERLKFGIGINNNEFKYSYKLFALCDARQKIYERINKRVDQMVNLGLLEELKYLLSLNLKENSLCLKAIGYKELIPYAKGENTLGNCLEILKQKTRNYAKRQFTFMNQFDNLIKINLSTIKDTAKEIYNLWRK